MKNNFSLIKILFLFVTIFSLTWSLSSTFVFAEEDFVDSQDFIVVPIGDDDEMEEEDDNYEEVDSDVDEYNDMNTEHNNSDDSNYSSSDRRDSNDHTSKEGDRGESHQ